MIASSFRRPNDLRAQIDRLCHLALARAATEDEAKTPLEHAAKHGLPSACRVVLNSNEFVFVD